MKEYKIVVQNVDSNLTPKAYDKFGDDKILWTSIFRTVQGEGPYAGCPSVFLRLSGCNFGGKDIACHFCFPESESIFTSSGKKNIGEVDIGDTLYTLNDSGELVETKVVNVINRAVEQKELYRLKYKMPNGIIRSLVATKDHPFHTTSRGYVPLGDLMMGENIYRCEYNEIDDLLASKSMKVKESPEKIGMFLRNGAEVLEVYPINKKTYNNLKGDKDMVEVVNFTCYPHNHFIIGDLHVHNCDTNFQFDKGNLSTIEELVDLVVKERKYVSDILVITGGEPTLQKNLREFIDTVHPYFSDVQIETNGTQVGYFKQYDVSEDTSYEDCPYYPLVVVSPKALVKAGKYPKLSDSVLKHATCLKFVLDSNPESPHHTVPEWALEWGKETGSTVYVSPMAIYAKAYEGEVSSIWEEGLIDKELTSMNYKYAAEYAMEHGLVVSTQQHLFYGLA